METISKRSDEQGWRWYNDKVSVTTVLSNAVANPSLNNWFKNNSKNQIEKVQRETSSFGTECHAFFENLMQGVEPLPTKPEHGKFISIFKKWMFENKVKAKHLELAMASEKYGYAGSTDFVGHINGKLVIADWKITKSYRVTNGWQLGAYRMAYKETYGEDCGLMGVQFDRVTGDPKVFEYEHYDFVEDEFLHALQVFKGLHFKKLNDLNWKWLKEDAIMKKYLLRYALKNLTIADLERLLEERKKCS